MTIYPSRQQKAKELIDSVQRLDNHSYRVKSQSSNNYYDIIATEYGWACSCPDFTYRNVKCKHQFAVEFSLQIRKTVESQIVIKPINVQTCPICQTSDNVVRHGIRHNKSGDMQRFFCKLCDKWFVINLGFEKMRATPQMITNAMQLYFTGESLRNVQKFLKLQGVKISHVAVYKWIHRYVGLMDKYLDTIKPNVSSVWRTDELYLKIKGDRKYLFAIMDDETRFWIAQQVSDNKNTSNVRPMFKESIEITGKKPKVLISDGAHNFHLAYNREFFTISKPRTQHIREIRFNGCIHNNKMERLNGEIRDREKTMRGLKKTDTPILKGYQIYHNYVRPHESLDNDTPAKRCGIEIEGANKWLTIIQNASSRNVPTVNRDMNEPIT